MPVSRLSGEPMKAVGTEILPYNCVLEHSGIMKVDVYTVGFLSLFPLKPRVCSRFSGERATPTSLGVTSILSLGGEGQEPGRFSSCHQLKRTLLNRDEMRKKSSFWKSLLKNCLFKSFPSRQN